MLFSSKRLILPVLGIILASMACNIRVPGPETPAAPIPITTEAVESLEDTLKQAYEEALTSGKIDVTITEEQLTSAVAFELEQRQEASFRDVQVYLRDGKIQVYGTMESQNITATAQINVTATVDAAGEPQFAVESANFGPLPIPDTILDQIESNLNDIFNRYLDSVVANVHIESITIGEGTMTITGRTR